jgi:hypothetical protein
MKKSCDRSLISSDILPEYDFSKGVRGKHFKSYRKGHAVKILKADGSSEVKYFKLEDGAVMLEPQIKEYFPDSDSVNKALRCLIPLMKHS